MLLFKTNSPSCRAASNALGTLAPAATGVGDGDGDDDDDRDSDDSDSDDKSLPLGGGAATNAPAGSAGDIFWQRRAQTVRN